MRSSGFKEHFTDEQFVAEIRTWIEERKLEAMREPHRSKLDLLQRIEASIIASGKVAAYDTILADLTTYTSKTGQA